MEKHVRYDYGLNFQNKTWEGIEKKEYQFLVYHTIIQKISRNFYLRMQLYCLVDSQDQSILEQAVQCASRNPGSCRS